MQKEINKQKNVPQDIAAVVEAALKEKTVKYEKEDIMNWLFLEDAVSREDVDKRHNIIMQDVAAIAKKKPVTEDFMDRILEDAVSGGDVDHRLFNFSVWRCNGF